MTVIGLPTNDPQWAASFLHDTKLVAKTSTDSALLRKLFVFTSPPYGVVLDSGRVKSILTHFDAPEPQPSLQQVWVYQLGCFSTNETLRISTNPSARA